MRDFVYNYRLHHKRSKLRDTTSGPSAKALKRPFARYNREVLQPAAAKEIEQRMAPIEARKRKRKDQATMRRNTNSARNSAQQARRAARLKERVDTIFDR